MMRFSNYSLGLAAVLLISFIGTNVTADVPELISFQGRLTDAGAPVPNDTILIQLRIYDAPSGGTTLWDNGFRGIAVINGLFTYLLGDSTALPDNLFSSYTVLYLGVKVGVDPEISPRSRLTTVGYSYQALRADSINWTGIKNIPAGLSDGDDNTTYTAGTGLQLTSTTFSIAPNGVTSTEIASDAVSFSELATNSVGNDELQVDAVTGDKILGSTITTSDILNGTIIVSDMSPNSIGSTEIQDNAVGSTEIATGAVGTVEILDESILSTDIFTSAVTSTEIATGAVGGTEILDASITSTDIATGAVGAAEILDASVGSLEIATGAVNTSEVSDGSLTAIDIDDEPGVASNLSTTTVFLDGTVETLLSRVITAPASGYVFAIGTAEMQGVHTNGTSTTARIGVSDVAGTFPANQSVSFFINSVAATATFYEIATVHGLFVVTSGAHTFYLLAEETSGSVSVDDLQLTLIYFPTDHGTVVGTTPQ